MDFVTVVQLTIAGITNGAVYALIALGFTVTFNASRVVNFAQGTFVTLGSLLAVSLVGAGLALPLAALAAVAITAAIAALIYLGTVSRVPASDVFARILVTLGLAIGLEGVMRVIWGTQARRLPTFTGDQPLSLMGATVVPQALWVIAGSAVVMSCLFAFFRWTRAGHAMLATSENREGAALLGIGVNKMAAAAFVLGASLAAVGGLLIAPMTTALYSQGIPFTVRGFAAAVVGGFGNPVGAVVGGLTIGLLEAYAVAVVVAGYQELLAAIVIILFLILRPRGLVGSRVLT